MEEEIELSNLFYEAKVRMEIDTLRSALWKVQRSHPRASVFLHTLEQQSGQKNPALCGFVWVGLWGRPLRAMSAPTPSKLWPSSQSAYLVYHTCISTWGSGSGWMEQQVTVCRNLHSGSGDQRCDVGEELRRLESNRKYRAWGHREWYSGQGPPEIGLPSTGMESRRLGTKWSILAAPQGPSCSDPISQTWRNHLQLPHRGSEVRGSKAN